MKAHLPGFVVGLVTMYAYLAFFGGWEIHKHGPRSNLLVNRFTGETYFQHGNGAWEKLVVTPK